MRDPQRLPISIGSYFHGLGIISLISDFGTAVLNINHTYLPYFVLEIDTFIPFLPD